LVIDRSLVNFDDENKSSIIEYRDQKIGDNASNNLFRITRETVRLGSTCRT
jgi:hypothetical protein